MYKWNPADKLSIDFFCQIVDPLLLGKAEDPENVYLGLFAPISNKDLLGWYIEKTIEAEYESINRLMIFQSQRLKDPAFVKRSLKEETDDPINNKVCEFSFDVSTGTWVLFRVREDKNPKLQ